MGIEKNEMPRIGRKLTNSVICGAMLLTGCSSSGMVREADGVKVVSVGGGKNQVRLLADSSIPTLVVKSPRGIGNSQLRIPASLPNGLIIEFPGFESLEEVRLDNGQKQLVCSGGQEVKVRCRWGNDWPVGEVKRYPTGMTLTIPASVFSQTGKWRLQWVDYFR